MEINHVRHHPACAQRPGGAYRLAVLMGDLIQLDPHSKMTSEQALLHAARNHETWTDVILLGFDEDGAFKLNSSHVSRELALWLIETAKMYVMQLPMPGSVTDEEAIS